MVTQRKAAGSPAAPTKTAKSVKSSVATDKSTAAVSSRASRQKLPAGMEPGRRREYVEVAAYFIAERRGFMGGDETADWLAAEAEIDRLIAGR